jgi:uncharacterized protein YaaN involved in tellurite resistance
MVATNNTPVTPVPEPLPEVTDKSFARKQLNATDIAVARTMAEGWLKDNLDILGIVHVGDKELTYAASAGRKLLANVRTNQYPEAGRLVLDVMKQVREMKTKRPQVDPDFMANLEKGQAFFAKIANRFGIVKDAVSAYLDKARDMAKNFDMIAADGKLKLAEMETGVSTMEAMVDENVTWTKQALIADAALEFLLELLADRIEKADSLWAGVDDRKNGVAQLEQMITLTEKKLGDLNPRIAASRGTTDEFRMSINADSVNAMAFNSFLTTGIGAFIEQTALKVNKARLQQGAQLYDTLTGALNEAYVEGAETIKEVSVIEADMLKKQMITVETLDTITDAIIEAGQTHSKAVEDAAAIHDQTEEAIRRNMKKLDEANKDLEELAIRIATRRSQS